MTKANKQGDGEMSGRMDRADVLDVVAVARERGEVVNLVGANLESANLEHVNLRHANLVGANLSHAALEGVNLVGAKLVGANLSHADLRHANLEHVNLVGVNLSHADLRHADLVGAYLEGANLRHADLRDTGLLSVTGLSSGHAIHMPTPAGWVLRVGCWTGTTDDLRVLIAGDDWPDAQLEQITARRPILSALADMADAWAADHTHLLTAVMKQWGRVPARR